MRALLDDARPACYVHMPGTLFFFLVQTPVFSAYVEEDGAYARYKSPGYLVYVRSGERGLSGLCPFTTGLLPASCLKFLSIEVDNGRTKNQILS